MPKFLTNIDLQKNELQNAVLQVISGSDPSAPNTGQVFYDGNTNQIKVYTGSAWESLATAVDNTEHIFDTALKIGRDADNLIDFTTDNIITFRAGAADQIDLVAGVLRPTASDGVALGSTSLMWSDLFLASGGVVNFDNGDMTLTHSANTLTFAGGTTATAALTASGIIKTDDTTAATTTTDGSLQTDGGLSVVLDAVIGDDLILISDAAVLSLGAGKDVTITHDNGTGGTLASAGNFVVDSTGGTLTLDGNSGVSIVGGSSEIDVTTTGALDLNSGAFTLDASTLSIDSSDNANITVGGTSKTLDIDASGALTIDSATSIAIGANADKPIDIDSSTLDIDASGALTIDSATSIAIGAAADKPIDIDSSTLDIDASGAITIDSASTISIDGANDVNLSITSSTAGEDLTIQQIGANDSSILITAAGTGTDAVKIDATAGDMLIAPNLIDGKTLKIGPSGATQIVLTPHGTAGNEKISIINSSGTADDAIKIDAASGGLTLAAGNDSLIIDADGTDADALQLSSAGGIDINATGGAAKDINIDASGSVHIKSTESASDSIKIHSTIGGVKILADAAAAGEDIVIEATGSSVKLKSTESASDAIVLESTLGGIDILASGAAAGEDIDIIATGSSVNITSTENAANAVYLRANGGASETIKIHSDQGTGAASIQLLSDVGGITLTGDTDHGVLVGTVNGAPISIGHTTSETTVNDNLTVTGTLTATGGLTNNSGVLTILDDTASATDTGGKLILASNDTAALGDTHRLGVIEFQAAEDDGDTMVTGARIEATAEAAWSGTENGTALEFYTTDADAAQGIALTLDSDQKASFASDVAIAGNLTVAGTTTTENTTIIESTVSVLQFEGANDNAHETILKVVEPIADTTFSLPAIAAGNYFIAALADAATATSAAVTATEFALLDGGSSIGSTAVSAGHGIHMNHGGSMAHTDVDTLDTYFSATTKTLTNKTLTTPVLTSPTVTTSIVPTNANTATLGTADKEWGDLFLGDGGVIKLGSDQDVTLTHVADAGITLNSAMKLHFGDTDTYIHQSADGVLDLVSDNEIELNATTVDLNGALDVSGTALVTGVLTTTAAQVSNGGISLTTDKKAQFRDGAIYINSSADGQLDIVADNEVQIVAATVDLNGALDVSGTALVTGVLTTTAQQISNGGMQLATDKKLEFRDSGVYINSDADGYLEAVADTGISLKIGSTEQIMLADGVFKPTTDSDVDLGTSSLYWKDAFIDKITTTGVIELGHANDTTVARSSAGVIKVQGFNVPLAKSFVLDHDTDGVTAAVDGDTDSLTFTILHGFPAGRLIKAEILVNSSNYDTVFADVTRTDDNTMVVTFATAAVNGAYVALLTHVG
ncbi:hypothetical protein N9378_00425 [Flavobacteriaceae bacterium]|nr:hypothetical protein [Flavobacteriaceae bacterium]